MSRYIDSLPTPAHVEPKKLVVLTASRTGTLGFYNALKLLGYKPCHMVEVLDEGLKPARILREGIEGEIGVGRSYTRKDFDKWFADHDIILEMPFFMLRSILEAYPDAKFLLVQRSPEKWAKSYENTLGTTLSYGSKFPGNLLTRVNDFVHELQLINEYTDNRCTKGVRAPEERRRNLIKFYEEYIATVKRLVPPEQLKVLTLEDGLGWEEICPYLGIPVPKDLEWPGRNTPDEFAEIISVTRNRVIRRVAGSMAALVVSITAAGLWYRKAGGPLPTLSWFK